MPVTFYSQEEYKVKLKEELEKQHEKFYKITLTQENKLSYDQGFIDGFKANHYPDYTTSINFLNYIKSFTKDPRTKEEIEMVLATIENKILLNKTTALIPESNSEHPEDSNDPVPPPSSCV